MECTLCHAPGERLYSDLGDRLFSARGSWSLLRCPGCGLVWLDPQPRADEIPDLYAHYYTHADPESRGFLRRAIGRGIAAAAAGYRGRASAAELAMGTLLAAIGPLREVSHFERRWLPAALRGRVLDVGCGSGDFLVHMRALGWEVAGVEPDPEAAQVARTALGGADIRTGELEDAAFPESSFDAIALGHVLEHVPAPGATLRACRRLLRPGGCLVLATPNTASLGSERFGASWLHWDPPRHLHLFNRATLSRVASDAGFEVRSVFTASCSARIVFLASSLIEARGRLQGINVDGAGPLLHLKALAFWAHEYLSTRRDPDCGEELLAIAERPS